MRLRERTQDIIALKEVYLENEYRVPHLKSEDVILDIGAHIGCFALTALHLGAGKVVCYEPDFDNFMLLKENMEPYRDQVEIHNAAVWRSDRLERVKLIKNPNPVGTATSQVSIAFGDYEVETVALDTVLRRLGKVRLLKIDAEGSEWPVLYTSQELHCVEQMAGELHLSFQFEGLPYPINAKSMTEFLGQRGFDAWFKPHPANPEKMANFFTARRLIHA